MKDAIIYLHGFNSASLDLVGNLVASKKKLVVLNQFCLDNGVKFCTPNVDYRYYEQVISEIAQLFHELTEKDYSVLFMGSSLGGFTCEVLAKQTNAKAIMINPAILPSELLRQFIGSNENSDLNYSFDWTKTHCEQYRKYEIELNKISDNQINRTFLLDMGDELIDSSKTLEKYRKMANVVTFEGGSHSFEHMEEALPVIKKVINCD